MPTPLSDTEASRRYLQRVLAGEDPSVVEETPEPEAMVDQEIARPVLAYAVDAPPAATVPAAPAKKEENKDDAAAPPEPAPKRLSPLSEDELRPETKLEQPKYSDLKEQRDALIEQRRAINDDSSLSPEEKVRQAHEINQQLESLVPAPKLPNSAPLDKSAGDLRYGTDAQGNIIKPPAKTTSTSGSEVGKEGGADKVSYDQSASTGQGATEEPGLSGPQMVPVPAQTVPLVSPRISSEIGLGEITQLQGAEQQADVEAQKADELAVEKERLAENVRTQELLDAQERDRQRQALEDHLSQIQAKAEQVSAKKVDPNNYVKNLSTGQQILWIISAALGGFAGKTDPLAELRGAIERDINTQIENNNQEQRGLENAKGLYADKYRLFEDADKARAASRQDMLASAMMAIDAMAAKYDSPLIKAKAEQLKGQLAREFGHEQATLEKYVPAHMAAVGGDNVVSDIGRDEVIPLPNGDKIAIKDGEARKEVSSKLRVAADIRKALPKIKHLLSLPTTERLTPAWQQEYEAATKVFTSPEIQEGGRGGKGIFEEFGKPLKIRGYVFGGGVMDAARTIADAKEREAIQALSGAEAYRVRPFIHLDPKKKEQSIKYTILGTVNPENSGIGRNTAASDAIQSLPGAKAPGQK